MSEAVFTKKASDKNLIKKKRIKKHKRKRGTPTMKGKVLYLIIALAVMVISFSSVSYGYDIRIEEKLCNDKRPFTKDDILLYVHKYVESSLIGYHVDEPIELKMRDVIYYKFPTYDSVGNKFFLITDECANLFGPYFSDSDKFMLIR